MVTSLILATLGAKAQNDLLDENGFLYAGTTGSKCLQLVLDENVEDPCSAATMVFSNTCREHLDAATIDSSSEIAVAQWKTIKHELSNDIFYLVNQECGDNYGVKVTYQPGELRDIGGPRERPRKIEDLALSLSTIENASTFTFQNNQLQLFIDDIGTELLGTKFDGRYISNMKIVMGVAESVMDVSYAGHSIDTICQTSHLGELNGDVRPKMYLEQELVSFEFGFE